MESFSVASLVISTKDPRPARLGAKMLRSKTIHKCSYYCEPEKDIHDIIAFTPEFMSKEEIWHYFASVLVEAKVLSVREAPEISKSAVLDQLDTNHSTHTKAWIARLQIKLS